MKLEHFWYGLTDGDGYVFKRSNRVLSILTARNLAFLQALKPNKDFEVNWLSFEQLVAISVITRTNDKDKRQGTINHTILIPIKQYLALTEVPRQIGGILVDFAVPDADAFEALEVNP